MSNIIQRLSSRNSGDYLPAFGSGAGAPWNATNEQVLAFAEDAISLDADLSQKIHLLYHPRLLVRLVLCCSSENAALAYFRFTEHKVGLCEIESASIFIVFSHADL